MATLPAGALGAHDCESRFCGDVRARVARGVFPAVLYRGRHLFGPCDGERAACCGRLPRAPARKAHDGRLLRDARILGLELRAQGGLELLGVRVRCAVAAALVGVCCAREPVRAPCGFALGAARTVAGTLLPGNARRTSRLWVCRCGPCRFFHRVVYNVTCDFACKVA